MVEITNDEALALIRWVTGKDDAHKVDLLARRLWRDRRLELLEEVAQSARPLVSSTYASHEPEWELGQALVKLKNLGTPGSK